MASLLPSKASFSQYKDRYYKGTQEEYTIEMQKSTTVYIGNLSFYTTEEQIYELFSNAGEIKRVIMGLDRVKRTPCGFCFVEFYTRVDVEDCMKYLTLIKLDDRLVDIDLDTGFRDGRQFGRGRSGGQVQDEHRKAFDAARGGYGARMRGTAYDDVAVPTGGEYRGDGRMNQHGGRRRFNKRLAGGEYDSFRSQRRRN